MHVLTICALFSTIRLCLRLCHKIALSFEFSLDDQLANSDAMCIRTVHVHVPRNHDDIDHDHQDQPVVGDATLYPSDHLGLIVDLIVG
jgi:hypothetical protein